MSLEASQGVLHRVCLACGRRVHGTNTSGLCQFCRPKRGGGLCRSCPAVLTAANRSGYCTVCFQRTEGYLEVRRDRERNRRLAKGFVPCQHCQIRQVTRARHLCFRCSTDAAIRNLYPTTSKYARKGEGLDGEECDYTPSPCPEPTSAVPGTSEKIAVLEARLAARVELWHEDDVRFDHNSLGAADFTGGDDADQDEDAD